MSDKIDLSVKIGDVTFKNPVMPASGTFGYGEEFSKFFDIGILGAIVTKGVSLEPKIGNLPPRIFEGKKYLINSIGLENIGIDDFIKSKIPFMEKINCVKIVNFFGNNEEEYYKVAEKINQMETVHGIEINVSCPNVKRGGLEFGLNENFLFKMVKAIVEIADKKIVIVKISPLLPNVKSTGLLIEEAGADAITAVNTIKGVGLNVESCSYSLGNVYGGISGPLLKPVALRVVSELTHAVKIPIIGVGGIFSIKDALEFFMCGATAVQIGSANFANPYTMLEIIDGLRNYLKNNGLKSVKDICLCLN